VEDAALLLPRKHHSIRTIARAQGVHEATVRGHLDSALRRIRPFLEGKDEAA
jgi:DNA-binding CsgD family transcriptional regulator